MDRWLEAFLALLAIVNPLGNLPVFAELCAGLDKPTRRRLFNVAALTGLLTLSILALTGRWIMRTVFHIHMAEFQIAGGILLTVIAVRNIVTPGSRRSATPTSPEAAIELGIVPMAVPLLVGPGAISTTILLLEQHGLVSTLASIAAVFAATWGMLQASDLLNRVLGRFGALVLSRVLQIFIAAIGVRFLVTGIREVFALPAPAP